MSLSNLIIGALRQSIGLQIVTLILTLLAYPIGNTIYNLYFHPLSKFPGPKLWAATRIPYIYCLLSGKLVQRQQELHGKYGDIIRLAPDEISFATEQAWSDIYCYRRGHPRALRDKTYYFSPNTKADDIITTSDPKFHARARALLSHSFSEDALRAQYPLLQSHADILVTQFRKLASSSANAQKGALVNMTDWLNFYTMDIIGDLAFGESFQCLSTGEYHAWVHTLFSYLKGMAIAAAPRFYPSLNFIFQNAIPRSIVEDIARHSAYAWERINKRIDSKVQRPDFMTPFMKNNVDFEKMSREEILATFNFIIVAGAETPATILTGIFNHLSKARNKHIVDKLTAEVRGRFAHEKDITIDALVELPYLEAVINEGLRMCNSVPGGLPRVVPEGGDVYSGVFLPGGTRVGVRTYTINRSSANFQNPNIFAPERWLPSSSSPKTHSSAPQSCLTWDSSSTTLSRPEEYTKDHLTASKPFSIGFHSCLGRPLAWAEMRLVVARLFWSFEISEPEEETERVEYDDWPVIMLVQKGVMNLRVKLK